jgi:hypothetical protein
MRLQKAERRKPVAGLKGEDLVVSERVDIWREKSVQPVPLKWFPISVVLLLWAFRRFMENLSISQHGAFQKVHGVSFSVI